MDLSTLRRRPVLLVAVSTTIALLAAVLAAVAVSALTNDGSPRVDATLHITGTSKDTTPLVEGDPDGDAFPTATLTKLAGGITSLKDYAGRPVVVNFFASTCTPCVTEMPALEKIHRELGDKVVFLGIDVRESQKDTQDFVDRTRVSYDIVRDPAGKITSQVGVINLPATFLVDAHGKVVANHPGRISDTQLRDLLAKHFSIS
jgi:thiol-disulfide isomerase/thioredoxin